MTGHDPRLPDLRNLRDLGGLRTTDGRRVRHGLVYRSATPAFVDEEQARLLRDALGIRTRVDLRSAIEIEEARNAHLDAADHDVEHLPLRAGGSWKHRPDLDDPSAAVAAHYLRYLEHSGRSITAIVELVADPDRAALLVHCSAGKDRTGVSLAVMLAAVGVSHDEIVHDYARTREDLDAMLLQLRRLPAYEERLNALPEESLTAEPRSMELFLARLEETYGDARKYLAEHGLGDDTLQRLERALLDGS
jgi:protein tyrosine/serine phosphatase